jgi:hypothetical protein
VTTSRTPRITLLCAALVVGLVGLPAGAAADVDDFDEPLQPVQPPQRLNRDKLMKLYAVFQNEPSARDVQAWALRHHKLHPTRVHALQRNARLKGLVPEFEAGMDNMVGNMFSNTRDGLFPILPSPPENPNPESFKERVAQSSDQFTWRLRAVWSLDRLVFNAEMLDAMSLTALQENLVREVTTLYFSRRRLLASMLMSPPQDELEYFYELTRLEEITSTLDALTGGRFLERAYDPLKNL